MTSFSTYASRFLSTGASTAPLHSTHLGSQQQHKSLYQPFDSSEYASSHHHAGLHDDEEGLRGQGEESDDAAAPDKAKVSRAGNRRLPHLQAQGGPSNAHNHKMSGSSRLLAQLTGQSTRLAKSDMHAIRDMDDEDEDAAAIGDNDDEDEDDHDAYRGQRSRLSIPGAARHRAASGVDAGGSSVFEDQQTPGASVYAPRDEQDPFLAEDDLRKAAAPRARSRSRSRSRSTKTVEAARARGWLAHAADSSSNSNASDSSIIRSTSRRRSKQRALPDDIYRDPDEVVVRGDKGLHSYSDDEDDHSEQDQETSIAATTDDDEEDDDSDHADDHTPRKNWRAGRRDSRHQGRMTRSNQASSSLREPLLSSAGSQSFQPRPPGAFNGATSHLASADIYAYPHPPAKTGWTPWAPGNRVPLSQYKDKGALVTWLGLCAFTLLVAGFMALGARTQSPPSSPSTRPSPYYTLTRSIPILFLLTFFSVVAAAGNLLVLRNVSRFGGATIIRNGLIAVPLILSAGWMWAFAGSFVYDDERWSGGSWSTIGLRIISIIPLALAIYFARSVWKRKGCISRSLSVLEISADVVAKHPALLLLSLTSLGLFILISGPFLTIFIRLFLRGHFGGGVGSNDPSNVWKTDSSARAMAWLTLGAWIWTWLVLRGIQRVTVAGVVSHWYFHRETQDEVEEPQGKLFDAAAEEDDPDNSLPGPAPGEWLGEEQAATFGRPTHVDIVRASFIRATGSALGTVCLSALMLSIARVGTMMAASARWGHRKLSASSRVPAILHPLTHLVALLAAVSALLQGLSDFALIYVGVTGDGFAAAARRATRLTGRQSVKTVMESLVINMLLDLTTLALCFLTGLAGFLISAHNLHVPADAPLVGMLCAFVPYGLLRLCADVLSNAADTLYLCFTIDEASGEQHCKRAAEAFLSTDERLPF